MNERTPIEIADDILVEVNDRIRTLTAEVERLKGALEMCAVRYERYQDGTGFDILAAAYEMRCIARNALNGGSHE